MKIRKHPLVLLLAAAIAGAPSSIATTIDFDGLLDGTSVTTEYPGFTFTNAVVLTSAISLNEFDFPPRSGGNIVFDSGGPLSITFSIPISSFEGFFTYTSGLSLSFFDAGAALLGTVTSGFSNNTGLGGDPGSSPNELLTFSLGSDAIRSVVITGDPGGGSFTGDDFTTATVQSPVPVPEPSSLGIVAAIVLAGLRIVRNEGRAK